VRRFLSPHIASATTSPARFRLSGAFSCVLLKSVRQPIPGVGQIQPPVFLIGGSLLRSIAAFLRVATVMNLPRNDDAGLIERLSEAEAGFVLE